MATATGTNVKFIKVQTKQQYNDYTDKDGALIFVESERKIYVDGVAYGFSDSDVANKFLELTGGKMSGSINMDGKPIYNIGAISNNTMSIMFNSVDGYLKLVGDYDNQDTGEIIIGDDYVRINGSNVLVSSTDMGNDDSIVNVEFVKNQIIGKKGVANGFASLDGSGIIPSNQLPSYVDDVVEYPKRADFPTTGETGKLYLAIDTNAIWRWTGSVYAQISAGSGYLTLGETSSTAYRGDYGKAAYTHSQLESGNPHKVTKSDVLLGSVQNYGIATQAEAENGSTATKYMTPLSTKQAIQTLAPRLSWTVVS